MKHRKKVAIITFHGADNQGAVLQAYALQKTIQDKCNVLVEILDYSFDKIESTKHYNSIGKTVKSFIKSILMLIYYAIKRSGFAKFRREKLLLSKEFDRNNIKNSNDCYDVFITGSDQVWNLECSDNDYTYFLDFVAEGKNKYSYAASVGNYKFSEYEKEKVKRLIESFDAISVREKSAIEQLKEVNREIHIHPDPVTLLPQEDYISIMKKRLYKQKYIFVYLIQEDVNVLKYAEQYAKLNKCKIINNKKSIEFIMNNSPMAFLSWIYYADAVFTNSFHGTAFSVIFNKRLGADIELKDGTRNNRIYDLLEALKAEDCILTENGGEPKHPNSGENLKRIGETGIEYLKNICK